MNAKKIYTVVSLSIILTLAHNKGIGQTTIDSGSVQVAYTSFSVNTGARGIVIDWSVADPGKANYFEIQRSTDGKEFRTVAMVMGPDPRQVSGNQYECIDRSVKKSKKYYYRLKHVAVDGEAEISPVKVFFQ